MAIKRIRDPHEHTCPRCSSGMVFDPQTYRVSCKTCGYQLPNSEKVAEPAPPPARKPKPDRPHMRRTSWTKSVTPWADAAFTTAQEAYRRGADEEAIKALKRAVDDQHDFVDAHLWLGLLLDDPAQKREHLDFVIAYDPGNLEAMRELMVLNGRMTREQANRTHHYEDQQVRDAPGAVEMQTEVIKCPVCNGALTTNKATGAVKCQFCGYTASARPGGDSIGGDILGMALLERKAEPIRWRIGSRLLHCNQCGAERTIPARQFTTHCPFCGSNQVVKQDALKSFQQPDGLVPFRVTKSQADEIVAKRLRGLDERLVGLFVNNRVKDIALEGVYLPYWVFDAMVQVRQTRTDRRSPNTRSSYSMIQSIQPYTTTTFNDAMNSIIVPGVTNPPTWLSRQIGEFRLQAAVPYEPKWLAKQPAVLYDIEFDKAALDARGSISDAMKEKHGHDEIGDVSTMISASVLTMSFHLMLMPVWIGTLTERDDDRRTVLVNGQTGQVALSRRPD